MWPFGSKKKQEEQLIRWQKAVVQGSPDRLIMPEEKLRQLTQMQADNDIRIIKDSIRIIEGTKNPETRASRLSLLKQRREHLVLLDGFMDGAYRGVLNDCDNVLRHHRQR